MLAATDFYEAQRRGLGSAFLQEVGRSFRRILDRPRAGTNLRSGIRVRSVARFPYRILYRVAEAEILIVAVAHYRRRPGFWLRRLPE
jgi:toxin ParE1/3/4